MPGGVGGGRREASPYPDPQRKAVRKDYSGTLHCWMPMLTMLELVPSLGFLD
jgi:hypothetical protein